MLPTGLTFLKKKKKREVESEKEKERKREREREREKETFFCNKSELDEKSFSHFCAKRHDRENKILPRKGRRSPLRPPPPPKKGDKAAEKSLFHLEPLRPYISPWQPERTRHTPRGCNEMQILGLCTVYSHGCTFGTVLHGMTVDVASLVATNTQIDSKRSSLLLLAKSLF